MPQIIILDNMLANEGKGWFSATRSNCTWNLSTQTPGDGAASSLLITPSGTGECTLTTGSHQAPTLMSTHKYYVSFKVKFDSAVNGTFDWYWPVAEPAAASGMAVNATAGVWTRVSATFDRTSFANGNYQCRMDYNNDDGGNKPFRFTSCLLLDLTPEFGAGKEPSKEWMDAYITTFADTLAVSHYENLKELFTDIATAIRKRDGTTGKIFACDFPRKIATLKASTIPSTTFYTITAGTNVSSISVNGVSTSISSVQKTIGVEKGDAILVFSDTYDSNSYSMNFNSTPTGVSLNEKTKLKTGTSAIKKVGFIMPASNLTVSFTKKTGSTA